VNATVPVETRLVQIVEAARAILEDGGREALTMRRVADRLGIRAPSLYKHVGSKEELEALLIAEAFRGFGTAVLDLRSLSPYDWEAIARSVQKTGRAIVVYEDPISWGYGAEIAARIASELFSWLDAPVERVAATDTFVAYQPQVEDFILPQASHVRKALEKVIGF
jgi:pyruvate/2-oxoglutarate/acetoin dehydrogenase E1 component